MNDDTQEKEFDFFRAPEPVAIKQTPNFQVWLVIGMFFWILVLSIWASISIPILLLRGGNPAYITTIENNIGHECWNLDRARFVGATVTEQINKRVEKAHEQAEKEYGILSSVLIGRSAYEYGNVELRELQLELTKICSTKPEGGKSS
ncbi:hypothetical protein [Burkholderia cenocepacia]|uniref:hypothetical protein n=1 Tax=Burkholderia cenocepacia TaxID=95486 RepID=UPI00223155A9|nr:hypothetical protein [Burkholderia cenocepacia]MCW3498704.1 hypothetical protein [Burkholderia cenocepacia]MCW3506208.1 hypothetical protein [Burkholderia cenocepacia]MCW3513857.1 hypothetical protein [Burkholderia cenocepacia]MCW3529007.1 hypothetical protein [Burkholderia cenocepacia]MCW3544659.1 hypothetical protein [Burkholderia cenocepacia]